MILICEGRCNPGIEEITRLIRHHARDGRDVEPGDGPLATAMRRVHYTSHEYMSLDRYACIECGHVRQYG